MIKKFLSAAMVAVMLMIVGCDSEVPKSDPPTNTSEKDADNVKNDSSKIPNDPKQNPIPAISEKPPESSAPPNKNVSENKSKTLNIKVYYPDDSGMKLVQVDRQIKISDDTKKYAAAVELLIQNPKEKNLTTIFPKSAKVRSVNVKDGTATVDFDKNLKENFAGGSTGEIFLVDSVVNTLTEFPEVKQVRFLIDGKEIETLSGHADLSNPIKRDSSN